MPPIASTAAASPAPPPAESDEDLARSAQAGSMDAFERLVRRLQVPLLRFLRRGPSPREAEDVLQETWLRAYRSFDQYRPGRPFKPWIFTIAYRLAVDAARRAPARSPQSVVDIETRPGPAERAASAEWAERLWRQVRDALGEEGFAAAWLHYGESMSPRQVAQVMGRSQVWARTTLYRSRKRLAEALGGQTTAKMRDTTTDGTV